MKKRHAFTLVELLVVIAIIAVLLAVLMPSLTSAKSLAKRLQCGKKLSGIGRAFNMYTEQYQGELPTLENHPATGWGSIESTYLLSKTGVYVHLGCLYGAGFVEDGQTFFCPAVDGWYGEMVNRGQNNGTYLGAVHATTLKFADVSSGVSQPNQGWKATKGYCYWPLAKTMIKDAAALGKLSSGAQSRYKVGLPYTASKLTDLNMTRPLVTDNQFHSTKMSGWLIDCLYPDGHVVYQKQPKRAGLNASGTQGVWGMYSDNENCQFPKSMQTATSPVTISDLSEKDNNLATAVTPTEFSYALEQ